MDVLIYNELDATGAQPQFERTLAMLRQGDFRGADAKKLRGTPFYRAKLNDSDRLLFRFGVYDNKTYLLLLEVIYRHAYDKSRFLNAGKIDEEKLEPITDPEKELKSAEPLRYVNPEHHLFHLPGRIVSLDNEQTGVLNLPAPIILIGSAGSGKTILTLEKMKQHRGEILYVTHSPYLVECARDLYYSNDYDNQHQEIDFLDFTELLAATGIPGGKPLDYRSFNDWFQRHRANTPIKDAHMLFEEFNGVLTGCPVESPYLSREEYLELGIRRSIFTADQRNHVYELFTKYLGFLQTNNHYNSNMLAHSRLNSCEQRYDFAVVDEVQDITNVQLRFILRHLRRTGNFLLSGDSNQIVHPNFFSWAALKSMFYEQSANTNKRKEIIRVLAGNYRNSRTVTELANKLLLVKHARFGSVDRESNYLVRCVSEDPGEAKLYKGTSKVCNEFDQKTSRSTRHAVLVLHERDKQEAARLFNTPLIFSVQEIKGLEYENIILYNLVSSAQREFKEIIAGVTREDLRQDTLEYARSKDKADKSLEIYKFYINALYVSVTRSTRNIYLLEQSANHPLFQLLEMVDIKSQVNLSQSVSSEQEWKSEAGRLQQQGKTEQAEAIRRRVLGEKPVPWRVVTEEELEKLEVEALDSRRFNKKAKNLLFEYALIYQRHDYLPRLAELNFKPALNPEQFRPNIERRYTEIYRQNRLSELNQRIKNHGPDFRDQLNRTPLMLAASLGMHELAKRLINEGASMNAVDNNGRNPFIAGLISIMRQKKVIPSQIADLFQSLPPPPLNLRAGDKMIKLDPHNGLFFTFYAFVAQIEKIFPRHCEISRTAGLKNSQIVEFLKNFPNRQVPEYRKRPAYISGLLAANEYTREGRRIFLRFKRGHYLLNPELQIQVGEKWMPINQFTGLNTITNSFQSKGDKQFAETVLQCLEEISRNSFDPTPGHSTGGLLSNPLFRDKFTPTRWRWW